MRKCSFNPAIVRSNPRWLNYNRTYTVVSVGDKLRRLLSLIFVVASVVASPVVAVLILSPDARAQQVIFDNAMAPLPSYFFNDPVGVNPVTGQNVLIAFPFAVQGASYVLDEVGLVTSINGPGAAAASGLSLFVYADAGGKPGVVLESWQGVPVTSTIALQTAMSVKHPILQPGQYWFGVTTTAPQQTAVWWVSPASAQSAICDTLNGTPGDCFTVAAANGFEILGSRCQSASSCSETLTIYQTGFEPTTFGHGTINGQDSWFVNGQPSQSLIETTTVETGVQAVEITPVGAASGDVGPQRNTSYDATNQILTFGIDANLSVSGLQSSWTVLYTQYNSPPSDIDFNIDPSGEIHIFSGSLDHPTGVMITRGVWNQYELEVNFISHTIRAFYNGVAVLQGLAFPAAVTALESYGFFAQGVDAGTDVGTFDNLSVIATPGEGLVTSQTGVTFRASPGGPAATQTVQVLSPSTSISWTVSVNTLSGGSWLAATPSGGTATPTSTPIPVSITVNASALAAQNYYGSVTLTPAGGVYPPVTITVVLSVVAAGTAAPAQVSPTGLAFLGAPGASPPSQSFTISTLASTPLGFTATAVSSPTWFSVSPTSGTINTATSATIVVSPASASLAAGVYPGTVTLAFSDSTTQTVTLVLVISSTGATTISATTSPTTSATTASNSSHRHDSATAGCTPSKLLPVFTTLPSGFNNAAAWPTPIVVQVVDDCGNAFNTGSVIVSFSNGDPPIGLLSIGSGNWAGTWVPQNSTAGFTVNADAQQLPLIGSAQVSGQVFSNPTVPIVFSGGLVSSGDYTSLPALGLLVSIFGSNLADGSAQNSSLPLPPELGTTSVVLSGGAQLPLLYVSSGQINVLIPYDAAVNATHQVVVQRNNAISVPVSTAVFNAAPGILTRTGNGLGQGDIYVVAPSGAETLADQNAPATAGNTVVIYCVGLGAVNPTVTSGGAAPVSPLSNAIAQVTVNFGGQTAVAGFSGLTPGFAGLYQINVVVPTGITPGNQVPVTLSAGGKTSAGAVYMAIK
jgi:adhesin/invasin